ncbi:MAG: DUF5687 family protein [Chitinophagaceae bacterium]
MITTFLSHQWKSFWRSRSAGKSLAIQILIGFFTIYFSVSAIALGFFLQDLIKKVYPGQDVIQVFCGFIFYYFLFDTLIRFLLQDLPALSIQPYLVQNIKRSQLIRFLNIRSLFTIFNLIPIFLFTPFTMMSISRAYGAGTALAFMASILALTVFNHFLILYIKRKGIINSWLMVIFLAVIAGFIAADYFNIFSLTHFSALFFSFMLQHAWLCLVLIALAGFSFYNNYSFLLKNLYLEDIVGKGRKKEGAEYAFLNRFGAVGELIALDIKLILRNKRPRTLMFLSIAFLFYGFIFYKPQYIANNQLGFLVFGSIFITGIFIINYGQFLFAWQSAHFDGLMAGHLNIKTYIKSKFVFFTIVCVIILVITSLYGLLTWKLLLLQVAAFLYNIGITTVITVFFATYGYKAIDINKGSAFNYQGVSAEKWLYSIMIFIIPFIIYLPLSLLVNAWAGIIALSVLGLASFLLQDWWVDILTKEFLKRKYKILTGFREK